MSKAEAKKIVRKYARKLREKKYPFTALYLFGSYAKGNARKWSDIDIAVLSSAMKKNWNKSEETLWKLGAEVDPRIEPVGFSPENFRKGDDPMIHEIKTTGVKVAVK